MSRRSCIRAHTRTDKVKRFKTAPRRCGRMPTAAGIIVSIPIYKQPSARTKSTASLPIPLSTHLIR
eukprot:scaffold26659_cov19-Prasinocladus_malaysianus.AAC.1